MKLYREDQKYHDTVAIIMVAALSLLLVATLLSGPLGFWRIALALAAVTGIAFLILNLRLKIRISPKKMSIRVAPFPWTRVRVPREEVNGVEFIASRDGEIENGWAVHFGGKLRIFNFGDRKGMLIHRKDGRAVVIFSRKLYENQGSVVDQLRSNGWNLS